MISFYLLTLHLQRPYEIHANTSLSEVRQIFASESVHYPTTWSREMIHLLHRVSIIYFSQLLNIKVIKLSSF